MRAVPRAVSPVEGGADRRAIPAVSSREPASSRRTSCSAASSRSPSPATEGPRCCCRWTRSPPRRWRRCPRRARPSSARGCGRPARLVARRRCPRPGSRRPRARHRRVLLRHEHVDVDELEPPSGRPACPARSQREQPDEAVTERASGAPRAGRRPVGLAHDVVEPGVALASACSALSNASALASPLRAGRALGRARRERTGPAARSRRQRRRPLPLLAGPPGVRGCGPRTASRCSTGRAEDSRPTRSSSGRASRGLPRRRSTRPRRRRASRRPGSCVRAFT